MATGIREKKNKLNQVHQGEVTTETKKQQGKTVEGGNGVQVRPMHHQKIRGGKLDQ